MTTTQGAANRFEAKARAAKAAKLVAAAHGYGYTAEQVAGVGDPQAGVAVREHLVNFAGVKDPSAATWQLVVQVLAATPQSARSARTQRASFNLGAMRYDRIGA